MANITFKDVDVEFGSQDANVTMAYTLGLDLSTSGTNFTGSVLYDELRMISTMDVRADDDIVFITLKENKLDVDS